MKTQRVYTYLVYVKSCEGTIPYALIKGSNRVRRFCRTLKKNTGIKTWWVTRHDLTSLSAYGNDKIFYL